MIEHSFIISTQKKCRNISNYRTPKYTKKEKRHEKVTKRKFLMLIFGINTQKKKIPFTTIIQEKRNTKHLTHCCSCAQDTTHLRTGRSIAAFFFFFIVFVGVAVIVLVVRYFVALGFGFLNLLFLTTERLYGISKAICVISMTAEEHDDR